MFEGGEGKKRVILSAGQMVLLEQMRMMGDTVAPRGKKYHYM